MNRTVGPPRRRIRLSAEPASRTAAALLSMLLPGAALAHGGAHILGAVPAWDRWTPDPAALLLLGLAAGVYVRGLLRAWGRAGRGRIVPVWRALAYVGGLLALALALVSPLEAAAEASFALHMVQHLLLMLVGPPLLVLGAPDLTLLWALPARWRGAAGRWERRWGERLSGAREGAARGPLAAVLLASGALWVWHVPVLYDLALRNTAVHWLEHAAFVLTALLFWTAVLRLRPRDRSGNGLRILYVFAMAMQGSILGALITLAGRPLYAGHAAGVPMWGLSALEDQQLAGLIMWVPPALLYLGVTAWLFAGWLADAGRREAGARGAAPRRGRMGAVSGRARHPA